MTSNTLEGCDREFRLKNKLEWMKSQRSHTTHDIVELYQIIIHILIFAIFFIHRILGVHILLLFSFFLLYLVRFTFQLGVVCWIIFFHFDVIIGGGKFTGVVTVNMIVQLFYLDFSSCCCCGRCVCTWSIHWFLIWFPWWLWMFHDKNSPINLLKLNRR